MKRITAESESAQRVRARAICGQLLKQVETSKGGRPSKTRTGTGPSSRKSAAAAAGLSPDQAKTALQVAAIPGQI